MDAQTHGGPKWTIIPSHYCMVGYKKIIKLAVITSYVHLSLLLNNIRIHIWNVETWKKNKQTKFGYWITLYEHLFFHQLIVCWVKNSADKILIFFLLNFPGNVKPHFLGKIRNITNPLSAGLAQKILGPVVQSVVSLTSSLRVISLTILADSIDNILIFFAEKNVSSFCTAKATHIFPAKNFSIFAYDLI